MRSSISFWSSDFGGALILASSQLVIAIWSIWVLMMVRHFGHDRVSMPNSVFGVLSFSTSRV